MAWFVVNDRIKLAAYKVFGREGEAVASAAPEQTEEKVVDLMEALRRSLKGDRGTREKAERFLALLCRLGVIKVIRPRRWCGPGHRHNRAAAYGLPQDKTACDLGRRWYSSCLGLPAPQEGEGGGIYITDNSAFTDEDIELAAKREITVAHCPRSNITLACPPAPISKLTSKGVKVLAWGFCKKPSVLLSVWVIVKLKDWHIVSANFQPFCHWY